MCRYLFFSIFYSFSLCSNAQLQFSEWQYAAPFEGGKRDDGCAFSASGKGYYGCGIDEYYQLHNDFWSYIPELDQWQKIDTLPGKPRQYASIFEIGERIFLVGGSTNDGVSNDVFEFDTENENWIIHENAPFPGVAAAASFVYRDKGYLIGGRNDSVKLNDFWEFDSRNASWKKLPPPPFIPMDEMSAFSLRNGGFAMLGRSQSNEKSSRVYYFDFIYRIWHEIERYSGQATAYCECQPIGARYAVCAGGEDHSGALLGEAFFYDDSLDSFFPLPDLVEPKIRGMQSFILQNSLYYIGGLTPNFTRTNAVQKIDFEEVRIVRPSAVNLFPNPASEWAIVAFLESPALRVESVYLLNLYYQEMNAPAIINNNTVHINVSSLPAGFYWIKAGLSNGAVQQIPMIVK